MPAIALAATGLRVSVLIQRLLEEPDERLSRLRGVIGAGCAIVLGETEALPWIEGLTYLGRDPDAPSLLLPTNLAPSVPATLLERALFAQIDEAPPIAVLPDPPRIASVSKALPIARSRLLARLETARQPV
jgi:hypothetical protein